MKSKHKRLRTYDWKMRLITWTQNRCVICQRFLSEKQQKYCLVHSTLEYKKGRANWYQTHKELTKLRSYNRYHGTSIIERGRE